MISEGAMYHIESAASNECEAAIKKHGEFNSHHEAYSVLKEECEEVAEQFTLFSNMRKDAMQDLWKRVRSDDVSEMAGPLVSLERAATELAEECVQVAAVCNKWQRLIKKGSKEK